jgi:hypothetical protein
LPTADDDTDSEDEAVPSPVAARKIANWVANVRAWVLPTHIESGSADLSVVLRTARSRMPRGRLLYYRTYPYTYGSVPLIESMEL